MADSFALWWREAGLHSTTAEEPVDWRAAPKKAQMPPVSDIALAERPAAQPVPQMAPATAPLAAARPIPDDLAGFTAWLAGDPTHPESAWAGPVCLPPTQTGSRLLILADMPDDGFEDAARPFTPERLRFVGAMLAAIGLSLDDVGFAPLALRRPPGGLLDDPTVSALAGRMRHYLDLARPRAVLILSDRTSRALSVAGQPGRLAQMDLASGTVPVVALPNPDLLMRRPAAKAASWQTLRHLRPVIAP